MEFEQGQRRVPCVTCSGSGIDWRKSYDAQRLRADTAEAALKIAAEDAALMLKDLDAAEQRIAELEHDAARWNAFIDCARIRFFGWAGYGEKDPYGNSPGNYRHFGGEFWTIHDAPTADKQKAAEILNGFADAAIAALNPKPEAGSHEVALPNISDRGLKLIDDEIKKNGIPR